MHAQNPVEGREQGGWGAVMGQRRDVVKGLEMGGYPASSKCV